jgi:hypothetical protein
MKRKPSRLKVQPAGKTYRPKYPSFEEENPLENPAAYPYPLSHKMLQVLSVTGFTGALMLSTISGCDTVRNTSEALPTTKNTNPFPVSVTNLPYQPASFGTGLPSRMKSEDAIDLINQAFQKEGLELKFDTVIEMNGIRLPVNAYNEKYRLGYVWINHTNMGEGMLLGNSWNRMSFVSQEEAEKNIKARVDSYWEKYSEQLDEFVQRFIRGEEVAAESFRQKLNAGLPAIQSQKGKERFFKEQYYAYQLEVQQAYRGDEPSLSEEIIMQIAERIEQPVAASALMGRFRSSINRYSRPHLVGSDFTKVLNYELEQIKASAPDKEWRKRLESLISLLTIVEQHQLIHKGNPVLDALAALLAMENWQNRSQHLDKVYKLLDEQLLDFSEMEKMEKMAEEGEAFIAPISARDNRTILQGRGIYSEPEVRQQLRVLNEEYRAAKTEEEKDSIRVLRLAMQKEIYQQQKIYRDSLNQPVLRRLENDVRDYIQWAKAQQGY